MDGAQAALAVLGCQWELGLPLPVLRAPQRDDSSAQSDSEGVIS